MPAIQSLVLTDRESTPADHTFAPSGELAQGVYGLTETGVTYDIEAATVSISARKTPDRHRMRLVLKVPIVQTETINGVASPKVVRTYYAELSTNFPRSGELQERKNVIGMIQSALDADENLTADTLEDLQTLW